MAVFVSHAAITIFVNRHLRCQIAVYFAICSIVNSLTNVSRSKEKSKTDYG